MVTHGHGQVTDVRDQVQYVGLLVLVFLYLWALLSGGLAVSLCSSLCASSVCRSVVLAICLSLSIHIHIYIYIGAHVHLGPPEFLTFEFSMVSGKQKRVSIT